MDNGDLRNLERELGRLVGLMEGFGREMRTMREDSARREANFIAAVAEHDKRDDERFAANGREHETMNRALVLLQQHDAQDDTSGLKWHNWRLAIFGLIGLVASAVIGAATAHIIGPH